MRKLLLVSHFSAHLASSSRWQSKRLFFLFSWLCETYLSGDTMAHLQQEGWNVLRSRTFFSLYPTIFCSEMWELGVQTPLAITCHLSYHLRPLRLSPEVAHLSPQLTRALLSLLHSISLGIWGVSSTSANLVRAFLSCSPELKLLSC